MKIEVLPTQWTAEGETFGGGVHEIAKPTKKLLAAAGAAEAAGSIKVTASKEERAAMSAAVESDSESLKARAKAQEAGTWHEGNIAQFNLEVEQGLRENFGVAVTPEQYVEERKGRHDG